MNKSILISIRPEHVVKILNGEKTIEIRKRMPKCELPMDVYLYCTKGRRALYDKRFKSGELNIYKAYFLDDYGYSKPPVLNTKVVAKFTLNKIEDGCDMSLPELEDKSLLNINEICSYIKAKEVDPKMVYAWHIDNLEIFDKPKELKDFYYYKTKMVYSGMDCPPYVDEVKTTLTKAPQSWQYVWEKE